MNVCVPAPAVPGRGAGSDEGAGARRQLVGGGSQSALWRQIVADAFGARVACPTEPESAALGAALQAAAVVGGMMISMGASVALGEQH